MPRAIWSGAVSFGLVTIPVKLYSATKDKDVSFHLLHRNDGSRLKQLRWCPVDEREVPWDEIARGYEVSRDQYVMLTDEDFEKLPLPSKKVIDLTAFVPAEQIDPVYYEKTYYLEPEGAARKPFAMLAQALEEKHLTALAKIAIRSKEQLCALRPRDGLLVLETLYYPDEIRMELSVDMSSVKVTDKEMDLAFTLIDVLSEQFEPEKYHDEYREALMKLIEAKMEGQEIVEPAAAAPGKVVDLMAALRESVESAKKRRQEGSETQRKAG